MPDTPSLWRNRQKESGKFPQISLTRVIKRASDPWESLSDGYYWNTKNDLATEKKSL